MEKQFNFKYRILAELFVWKPHQDYTDWLHQVSAKDYSGSVRYTRWFTGRRFVPVASLHIAEKRIMTNSSQKFLLLLRIMTFI